MNLAGEEMDITFLLPVSIHETVLSTLDPLDNLRIEIWNDDSQQWDALSVLSLAPTGSYVVGGLASRWTEDSYWWEATSSRWSQYLHMYRAPSSYGRSLKFRVFARDPSGSWEPIPGLKVNFLTDYRPNVGQGAICDVGEPDCSTCVDGLVEQITGSTWT